MTLTSDEPVIQEFMAQNRRQSAISVKSAHSAESSPSGSTSSYSAGGGYGGITFDPDAMKRKQERRALKNINIDPSSPQTQILVNDTPITYGDDEKQDQSQSRSRSRSPSLEVPTGARHKPSQSVIYHGSGTDEDDHESRTTGSRRSRSSSTTSSSSVTSSSSNSNMSKS